MGLFKRSRQHNNEDPSLLFLQEKARNAAEQQSLLDRIGQTTDPLAESALMRMDAMPDDEKSAFMRSVFRQLVLQSLDHTCDDSKDRRQNFERYVDSLGRSGMMGYGTGVLYWTTDNDSWQEAVLDRSMPHFEQSELPL